MFNYEADISYREGFRSNERIVFTEDENKSYWVRLFFDDAHFTIRKFGAVSLSGRAYRKRWFLS